MDKKMIMEEACFEGKRMYSTTRPIWNSKPKEETMQSNDTQVTFSGVMKTGSVRKGCVDTRKMVGD